MAPTRTNEAAGTRAVLRYYHMSASKARVVLDLVRGKDVVSAAEILTNTPREAAGVIAKVLASAIANAVNNDGQAPDELFIVSAFADEGPTLKRFRPRARGRAGRIRKRTCHITIVVARMDDASIAKVRAARGGDASRSRRVSASRRRADQQSHARHRETAREEAAVAEAAAAEEAAAEAAAAEEAGIDADEHDATEHEGGDASVDATQDAADEVAAPEDTADDAAKETTD
jgi:large subunit ribosomal protein L22